MSDATPSNASKALEWYAERARSIARYLEAKQTDAVMAVVTELSLDAGRRAARVTHETTARSERLRLIALELSRIAGTFDIELSTKLGAMAAQILSLGDHLALGERITAVEPLPEQGA